MPSLAQRINIFLPKDLVEDLRALVPRRKRTQFVAEAVAKELRRLKLSHALEKTAGAWHDEDHPELASEEDIDLWLDENRAKQGWDRIAEG